MSKLYLEDLQIGTPADCGSFCLSLQEIYQFAARYDPQPFHLDPVAAKASYFDGIAASGLHTQAEAIGLMVRAIADVAVVAGFSLHEARFFHPVRPSVRYRVTAAWTHAEPSPRNPARGRAAISIEVAHHQDGTPVAKLGVTYVVATRPASRMPDCTQTGSE